MEVLKELKHPHIVRTFGGVSEDKQRFYAMELMPGGTLEDELQSRGRLTWEAVVDYGVQMCAALEYLHSKGVVHRDVKPSNFLKGNDGRIKLSDFGLASVVAERKITADGRTAGTFLYMAPEQIRGEKVVPQTDLYALGCVLFELLTGRPPLIGDTPAATLHKHCKQTPPRVTELALDCPLSLERLVAKLLEKSIDGRPRSAAEVARELRSVSSTVEVKPSRGKDLTAGVGNDPVRGRPTLTDSRTAINVPAISREAAARWTERLVGASTILVLFLWIIGLNTGKGRGETAAQLWLDALQASEPIVRVQAAHAVGRIGSEEGLSRLADLLKSDSEPAVREACASALGRAGEDASAYTAALIRARNEDEVQRVRVAAAQALKSVQRE
jgi:serine/threonine-protein kinase